MKAKADENFVSKINSIHDDAQALLIHYRVQKIQEEKTLLSKTQLEEIAKSPTEEIITIRTLQIPDELDDQKKYDVYNLEEYKKDFTWLKHAERIALKVHTRPGLKKLSQLSNKTLQQFLREQIHYSTRDAIRNEIEKRHTSNKLYKSLKTETLQQWYEDTRSLEIHNELERRKRAKEIGSFSTCTDMQLQHAILINTTKIKINASENHQIFLNINGEQRMYYETSKIK
jgi:hypothetical protein